MFKNEDLKVIIISSEIPFVGDDHETIVKNAKKI